MTSQTQLITPSRRLFMGAGATTSSAGALALLGGNQALAAVSPTDTKSDLAILNVAVGLEYEGINAYEIALRSGLLNSQHVKAATKFQDDHKAHNDALIGTIRKLGGRPVEAKSIEEYAKELKVDLLKTEDDVLDLAARLELGAANAYLGVLTAFKDPQLGKIAARLAADEAANFALLKFDLKRPFSKAFAFGA
jgi:rubrerythrin